MTDKPQTRREPRPSMPHRKPGDPPERAPVEAKIDQTKARAPVQPINDRLMFRPLGTIGSIDDYMQRISEVFDASERLHRVTIDRAVQDCLRTARFLWANRRTLRKFVSESTAQHLTKKGFDEEEFLRVVYLRSHKCPKKASFYFRATRAFYHANTPLDRLPNRVRESGGYRALAEANVRFPREAPELPSVEEDEAGGDDLGDAPPMHKRPVTPPSQGSEAPEEGVGRPPDVRPKSATPVELVCTFEDEGQDFLNLTLPCLASVGMYIEMGSDGRRKVVISSVVKVD